MEATQQEQIGQRIRARRKVCGMTQTALGDAVGLNKSTIQRYESGKIDTIKLPVLTTCAQSEPNDFPYSAKSPAENLFLHRKNENSL